MSRRLQENILATTLLMFFAVALVTSLPYGPRARLVPVPIALIGICLVPAQLIWQNSRSEDDLKIDVFEFLTGRPEAASMEGSDNGADDNNDKSAPAPLNNFRRELIGAGIVLSLLGLFLLLGPVPASFFFVAGYFAISREYRWPTALLYGAVFSLITYVIFGRVLHVDLNRGLITPWLNSFFYY